MPDARYRLEDVLADIKRLHQELQSQELQSQEMRPAWQPFALGFAIGFRVLCCCNSIREVPRITAVLALFDSRRAFGLNRR